MTKVASRQSGRSSISFGSAPLRSEGTLKITREEARRIADLAHLEFDDASLDRLAADMTTVLGYVEGLSLEAGSSLPVDNGGLKPTSTQKPTSTPMRDDEVRASLDRDVVASNAPAWSDGFFVVPKVIG
jgi:aspartyl-tRNA(Asn)/glutamyl-tRNA(Gln) amidotransferase subunit C